MAWDKRSCGRYMGKGKRVCVIGRLENQTCNDKTNGELRTRAVIVASQVLFLDFDRAQNGLAEEPKAESVVQPEVDLPQLLSQWQAKRSRCKQAA